MKKSHFFACTVLALGAFGCGDNYDKQPENSPAAQARAKIDAENMGKKMTEGQTPPPGASMSAPEGAIPKK